MTGAQKTALNQMQDAGEIVSRTIIHAKSSAQPLELPDEVVALLIEAQQVIFAVQRKMEKLV